VAAGTGSQDEIRKMLEEMIEAQNARFGATSHGHTADQVADHNGGDVRGLCWRLGYTVRP